MKHARALAAAIAIGLVAATAQGQTGRVPDQAGQGPMGADQGAAGQSDTGQGSVGQGSVGQGSVGQGAVGQGTAGTELAPDEAVTPAERPAEPPLAPAEGAPAPAPRPGESGTDAGPGAADPEAAGAADQPAPPTATVTPAPVPPAGPAAPAPAPERAPGSPGTSPVPPAEPQAPARAPAPEETPGAPGAAPVPAEDPADGAGTESGAEGAASAPAPAEPPVPERLAEDDAGLAACLAQLGTLGTAFERIDPVSDEGGACGISNPVRVSEIVPGVALEPAGVMRCATAAALAGWVASFVLPASRLLPEHGRLSAVEHGSAYLCRGISGTGAGGDLSQHAFGNALDVMGFRFDKGPAIPVQPRERDGTSAEAFQRTARASACLLFTTVLGPGEPDHDDHLHLDIEARGSGHRLCQ